jgi:hypothetical protein
MHMALHKHINIHTGIYCYDHPSNLMCDGWVGGVVGVKMMTVICAIWIKEIDGSILQMTDAWWYWYIVIGLIRYFCNYSTSLRYLHHRRISHRTFHPHFAKYPAVMLW